MNFEDLYGKFGGEAYPKIENIEKDYKFGKMLYNSYAGSSSELTTILQYIYQNIINESNKELQNVLIKIAIEEMHHLKILGDMLVELGFTPYYMGSMNNKWCSDKVKYQFKCIDDMLRYNIEGEKMAIKEYKRLIQNTNCKCIKDVLSRIIKDEESHIRIFEAMQTK